MPTTTLDGPLWVEQAERAKIDWQTVRALDTRNWPAKQIARWIDSALRDNRQILAGSTRVAAILERIEAARADRSLPAGANDRAWLQMQLRNARVSRECPELAYITTR